MTWKIITCVANWAKENCDKVKICTCVSQIWLGKNGFAVYIHYYACGYKIIDFFVLIVWFSDTKVQCT